MLAEKHGIKEGNGFTFTELTVTPVEGSSWKNVQGYGMTVTGYDGKGGFVTSGYRTVKGDVDPMSVKLSLGEANQVVTWGVVIQAK